MIAGNKAPRCAPLIHLPEQAALLTEKELAELSRLSTAMLRKLRRQGGGPTHVRIGKAIRYPLTDVNLWLDLLRAQI